ncbi:MAG TPA: hypothetical protein VFZ69_16410 [Longimicrobiales bacterium]
MTARHARSPHVRLRGHVRALSALLALTASLTACDVGATVAPEPVIVHAAAAESPELATLRRVTARYHDVDAAIADGFILLHGCEVRPGEGAVGILYVHLGRYMDGMIDPALPDGLLYAPTRSGKPKLTGVELAIPKGMWSSAEPPQFLGVPFQEEDEFDAFGLHIWVWSHNPDGMFAQAHPRVECGGES